MLKMTLSKRLQIPIYILGCAACFAVLVIKFINTEVGNANERLSSLSQYNTDVQNTEFAFTKFSDRKLSLAEMQDQLIGVVQVPPQLSDHFNTQLYQDLETRVLEIQKIQQQEDQITAQVMEITNAIIDKANSYMPYIRDKLLEAPSSATSLEIETIVGANTSTSVNYKIQTLFLQITNDESVGPQLIRYLDTSIENVEKDAIALQDTVFANDVLRVLTMTRDIHTLVSNYLNLLQQKKALTEDIYQQITVLKTSLDRLKVDITNATFEGIQRKVLTLVAGLIIAIVVSALINLAISKNIVTALGKVKKRAAELSQSGGYLTQRIAIENKDEIAEMSKEFNTFIKTIHGTVSHVLDASKQTVDLSNSVYIGNKRISDNVSEQQVETESVVSAIGHMNSSIADVSSNANITADSAVKANNDTKATFKVLEKTLDAVNSMRKKWKSQWPLLLI